MKKLLFIYNPVSGVGKVRSELGEITERFAIPFDYEVTLHPTRERGDAKKFAAERAKDFDRVICAGGDGTLNEVISGLLEAGNPPILGYIPTGTANDFSKTLGIPPTMLSAADCSIMGAPTTVDVGSFNGTPFIYVAAFGLFSDVSYTTPQEMKNTVGYLAYLFSGIKALTSVHPYHVKVTWDEGEFEDDILYGMVSDTISVGGMIDMKKRGVCLDDGKFEGMFIRMPKQPGDLNSIIDALMAQTTNEHLIAFTSTHVRIECNEEIPWTLDGEGGGNHKSAEISVLPKAITLAANVSANMLMAGREPEK